MNKKFNKETEIIKKIKQTKVLELKNTKTEEFNGRLKNV